MNALRPIGWLPLAAFAAALASGAVAAAEHPPVPLHKPLPHSPTETAGSGVAPRVSVALVVDERGRVTSVNIRRIEPSTSYDAAFEKEVRKALSTWRFAPAVQAARPVKATVNWTIQFEPAPRSIPTDQGPFGDAGWESFRSRSGGDDEEARWQLYVSRLDLPARKKVLEELAGEADRFLKRRIEHVTDAFLLRTDSQAPDAGATITQTLSAAYATLARMFATRVPALPAAGAVLVYAYESEDSFKSLAEKYDTPDMAAGFYRSPGLIAFHLQMPSVELLRHVMLHETTHAYIDRHLIRAGTLVPLWIHEGLAEYLANSDIKDGRLVLGGHRQKMVPEYTRSGKTLIRSESFLGTLEVKKAIRTRTAIPLQDLVTAEPKQFYGQQYRLFYTQAWMFVHFLRHGRQDWAEHDFPEFILYVAEGFSPVSAFQKAYGCAPAGLEEEFRAYAEKF